jgi:hypothetical protein
VVSTIGRLGHLGELRRGLGGDRRAGAQRLLDRAEAAAVGLGVADAGLDDGRGEHVRAVQAGDLLVRDAVGGAQVVEARPAHGGEGEAGVYRSPPGPGPVLAPVFVAEPDAAVADRVGAVGVAWQCGVGTVDRAVAEHEVAVVAWPGAVRPPYRGGHRHAVQGQFGAGQDPHIHRCRFGANAHVVPLTAGRSS